MHAGLHKHIHIDVRIQMLKNTNQTSTTTNVEMPIGEAFACHTASTKTYTHLDAHSAQNAPDYSASLSSLSRSLPFAVLQIKMNCLNLHMNKLSLRSEKDAVSVLVHENACGRIPWFARRNCGTRSRNSFNLIADLIKKMRIAGEVAVVVVARSDRSAKPLVPKPC